MTHINNPIPDAVQDKDIQEKYLKEPTKEEVKKLIQLRKDELAAKSAIIAISEQIQGVKIDSLMLQAANNKEGSSLWGAIEPIKQPPSQGRPYPIDALPEPIHDAVLEVQSYTQAPIALVANSALVCLATACQAHMNVARDENLVNPVSLFFLTLADSGERKTTCDSFFVKALLAYQSEIFLKKEDDLKRYHGDVAVWESKKEGLKSAIKSATQGKSSDKDVGEISRQLKELHCLEPERPRIPNIVRTDDTSEKLAHVLVHEWPSVGIISSEGGLVFASRALNKENVTGTLAIYNSLWGGDEWQIGRKSGGTFKVRGVRLSIGIHVQPEVLHKFVDSSENIGRHIGFFARCLFSFPQSTQGSRFYIAPPQEMAQTKKFHAMVRSLLDIDPKMERGMLQPETIPMLGPAKIAWIEFHNQIERQLAVEGKYHSIRDIASKSADNAARLATIFAASKRRPITEVDHESMRSGCSIAEWHLDQALQYFGKTTSEENKNIDNAEKLETWLIKQYRKTGSIALDKSYQANFRPNAIRSKEKFDKALELLLTRNRARLSPDGKKIEINPEILTSNLSDDSDQLGEA